MAVLKYADRVAESTVASGTGDIELAGAIDGDHATFGSQFANGDEMPVTVFGGGAWMTFRGRYNAGANSLTRVTFRDSSTGTNLSLSGTMTVLCGWTAADAAAMIRTDEAQALTPDQKTQAQTNLGLTVIGRALAAATDQKAGRAVINASGRLNAIVFVASQTFVTPADSTTSTVYKFTVIGAGGGGAGGGPGGAIGSGGGSGAVVVLWITGLAPGTSISIAIGAGGGAVAGGTAGTGGATTLTVSGLTVTCPGGFGGQGNTTSQTSSGTAGGGGQSPTVTNTGALTILGQMTFPGQAGDGGWQVGGMTQFIAGRGGNTPLGWGLSGQPATGNLSFSALNGGVGVGAGGSGSGNGSSGATGQSGLVVVEYEI
ncbi:hypothetical protein [Rhodopseudomonas sp.]|uniref:glycine-rich domain-containing protein n=1 Tax=Rhodopseudomonas sp. TaxID=1078 RepID=UPI003B3AC232